MEEAQGLSPDELVVLGVVAKPHGVRGELRVHPFNSDSNLLLHLSEVRLRADGHVRSARVLAVRRHHALFLLTLEGVVGRDAADALRGTEICVPRGVLPDVDPEEYYHVDLIGLRAEAPDGAPLGVIGEVIRYPSVDCLRLDVEKGHREVPLLDPYVVEVDLPGGRIVLDHITDFEVRR